MANEDNGFKDFKYYQYDPSMVAAIIFVILFAASSFLHTFQMIRTRTWFFIPFVIGGIFEFIGYIGRAASAQQSPDWTLGPYIIQSLLLLVAPALFAASIYMTLGRIILLVDGEAHSIISKRWLTKLFVAGDVLSFLMQGSGGGIMAKADVDSVKMGERIVVGGLFVQLVFFGLFIVTAAIFHVRITRVPTAASLARDIPWKKHIYVLYISSILILVRSVFRVIEYLQGHTGYLLSNEVFLYIFDAVLMFLVMLVFNWSHPSEVKALLHGGKYTTKFYKLTDIRSAV